MKRIFASLLLASILACSKDPPGTINIELDVDGIAQNVQDSVNQFVFVIGEEGSNQKLLYPSTCLGCSSDQTPCPVDAQCLKTTDCGFSVDDASFDPQIDFSDVESGATLEVIACGLDDGSSIVMAGSGTVENIDGETGTITMTTVPNVCTGALPQNTCD